MLSNQFKVFGNSNQKTSTIFTIGMIQATSILNFYGEDEIKKNKSKNTMLNTLNKMKLEFLKLCSTYDCSQDCKKCIDLLLQYHDYLKNNPQIITPMDIEKLGWFWNYLVSNLSNQLDSAIDSLAGFNNLGEIKDFASLTVQELIEKDIKDIRFTPIAAGLRAMPIYTKSGTIGLETIVLSIVNGFVPLGIPYTPYEVHAGLYKNRRGAFMVHDYIHGKRGCGGNHENCEQRLKDYQTLYKDTYFKIIKQPQATKERDIFILYFLMHELGFDRKTRHLTSEITRNPKNEDLYDYKDRFPIIPLFKKQTFIKEKDIKKFVIESIDLIYILRNLGFDIPNLNVEKGDTLENINKTHSVIRTAILDLWKDFKIRHPRFSKKYNKLIELIQEIAPERYHAQVIPTSMI